LSCSSSFNKEVVCDVCLWAKAHQLSYPVSSHQSSSPLDSVFSDVWRPAIDSFRGKKYYVSFIDDFSKFTWIYLLRRKSEVFKYFHGIQQLVERMFRSVGINLLVSCPHTHQ
jgi:hypothetical protein